jgi:hypothetical protein
MSMPLRIKELLRSLDKDEQRQVYDWYNILFKKRDIPITSEHVKCPLSGNLVNCTERCMDCPWLIQANLEVANPSIYCQPAVFKRG